METRHVNYKSDFVLRERFRNASGQLVALPDIDFELRYWVKQRVYVAKRENGVMTNCVADGDALLVMFKDHQLGEGFLHHELHLALDNELFSDGVQNVYYPENLNILLWDKMGDSEGVIESDIVAAYTRGFAFKFSDFTPAEIELLKQPATEAAALTLEAKEQTEQATRDTLEAKGQTEQATRDTLEAKGLTEQATRNAQDATGAAQDATRDAQQAKRDADAATQAAQEATQQTNEATRLTLLAKEGAELATQGASEAGQLAAGEAQRVEAIRTELEQLALRAEAALAEIPTGLRLVYPSEVTLGNETAQYIRATVLPVSARQNALFLADGVALDVAPDGHILPKQAGRSRVYVVPSAGTQHYKTIYVEVVKPVMRLTGDGIRIEANGNIRLT